MNRYISLLFASLLVLTFADDGALCLGGDAVREGKGTSRQQGRFA